MVASLKNQRGQTSLEYLLLLVVAFVTTYIVITGPLANATRLTLTKLRSGLQNTVRNGEWKEFEIQVSGSAGHPSDPRRFQGLHL